VPGLIRLGAIGAAGGVAAYGIMALLGPPVVSHGLAVDEPIFRWTEDHRVDWWAAVMRRLNTMGNVWTTWGAAGAAAACLGVSWRRQRWLPPAALGVAILVDHYATTKLHRTIRRLGPPPNPLGTYPAGGPDRIVLFCGLIAYLLWREFSGSRHGKIWAIGAVSALAFSQAYTREYLSQHWFIDIICGLLFGVLLLGPFIAAVRLIAGPAGIEASQRSGLPPGNPGPAGRTAQPVA
jgi:membrane-associated phospholipid phosphatase